MQRFPRLEQLAGTIRFESSEDMISDCNRIAFKSRPVHSISFMLAVHVASEEDAE